MNELKREINIGKPDHETTATMKRIPILSPRFLLLKKNPGGGKQLTAKISWEYKKRINELKIEIRELVYKKSQQANAI